MSAHLPNNISHKNPNSERSRYETNFKQWTMTNKILVWLQRHF